MCDDLGRNERLIQEAFHHQTNVGYWSHFISVGPKVDFYPRWR